MQNINLLRGGTENLLYIFLFILGTGESSNPNWYYNHEDQKCTAFLFTGSEGNANRFETQEQCERQCGEFKNQVTVRCRCLFP